MNNLSKLRIRKHPILAPPEKEYIEFTFNGRSLTARTNEVISSALFAHGIHNFKKHHKDGAPQGIFCANGQCGQCLVLADGIPVKACITPIRQSMDVRSLDGLPELPIDDAPIKSVDLGIAKVEKIDVLIVGAGPSGLAAAIELGKRNIQTVIADDKQDIGGKLSLQTHNFFGSIRDCFAGTRGMDIAQVLKNDIEKYDSVELWLNSPVVGVFSDKCVGIVKDGIYRLLKPRILLVATGAREKSLVFKGCDLPGVYGAGAFQTLVNRDLVRPSEKLFIVGGGNVGLIAAYHALQAGTEVVGLVEALPDIGGYKVHLDKLKRLGIPIYTSHTVLKAEGNGHVESIVISEIDTKFRVVKGTEKRFYVDTLLIAVGLSPVDELCKKAERFGMRVYSAGDAETIAEASAAMFSGRITGREILDDMGHKGAYKVDIPDAWYEMLKILRGKPGKTHSWEWKPPEGTMKYPIIRCMQDIPCNPCAEVCPVKAIEMPTGKIIEPSIFSGKCIGCGRCVAVCPGLAITLVDKEYDETKKDALVIVPWELPGGLIEQGMEVTTSGFEGEIIGKGKVIAIKASEWQDRRSLVALEVPWNEADLVAGLRIFNIEEGGMGMKDEGRRTRDEGDNLEGEDIGVDDDVIVCRCERVTKGEIRERIREGARDFNALKAVTRIGMGECGGKTCIPLIWRIFMEEGIDPKDVKEHIERPFTQEVPVKAFLRGVGEA